MIVIRSSWGSIVLDGAHNCRNSIGVAWTMVMEEFQVPKGTIVAGVPAKIKRPLMEEEKQFYIGRLQTMFANVITIAHE